MSKKIAIIGGGNLGTAIAEGLIKSGFSQPADIIITKRNTASLQELKEKGVQVSSDNSEAVLQSELVILAVKPYQVKEVLTGVKNQLTPGHILVSVLTGVLISEIEEIIQIKAPVFRAMPNTAIAIQESMTCLSHSNAGADHI